VSLSATDIVRGRSVSNVELQAAGQIEFRLHTTRPNLLHPQRIAGLAFEQDVKCIRSIERENTKVLV
jgi:hypothetical protein